MSVTLLELVVTPVTMKPHPLHKELDMSEVLQVSPSEPMEKVWGEVEHLVTHICNLFRTKHGGDPEDLQDTAVQVFVDVYRSWREGEAPFTSFLSTCIYRRLLDEKRKNLRINPIRIDRGSVKYGELEQSLQIEDTSRTFNYSEFLEEMTEDARIVVKLVLETPPEISKIIEGKGGHPKNVRSTIRQYLLQLNWTYSRINESFSEIAKVCCDNRRFIL